MVNTCYMTAPSAAYYLSVKKLILEWYYTEQEMDRK